MRCINLRLTYLFTYLRFMARNEFAAGTHTHTHTRLFDKAGYQKGRSSHRAGHQRQTNRQKRDRQKKNRITDKLMNKIIIPTETMDTVATMTSKQISLNAIQKYMSTFGIKIWLTKY